MITFKVPNLDGASETDLREISETLAKLARYADHKGNFKLWERSGIVPAARYHSIQCDEIYATLPNWAKWEENATSSGKE
jgi:hypothetical protein